nr:MAG TPA: hypothetical protein [Caudoviricetes sp.]
MAERNFHFEIRDASKHELVGLIEVFNIYIKQFNKLADYPLKTPEDLWNKLQEEKRRRKL